MDIEAPARLLGLKEVLTRLSIQRSTLYEIVADGRMPARKLGRRVVFLEADVSRFIESLPAAQIGRGRTS